jgi:multiple sugar transport system ATP-binding protein
MRVEINKLHRRLGATMIFVTHDQVEAMTLADRIVVLRAGIIEQVGSPLDLYNHPANLFVAGFIGSPRMNFLAAEAEAGENGQGSIKGKSGFNLAVPAPADLKPGKVTFGVRPENLTLVDPAGALVTGEVQIAEHLGGETFVYVALPSAETITVEIRGQATVQPGERVGINVVAGAFHIFDGDGRAVALPRN